MKNDRYDEAYGQWAGNKKGFKPDYDRCCEQVYSNWRFYQCQRKRGYGPDEAYCKQHAKRFQVERGDSDE